MRNNIETVLIESSSSDSEEVSDNDVDPSTIPSSSDSDSDDDIPTSSQAKQPLEIRQIKTSKGQLIQHRLDNMDETREILKKARIPIDENFFTFTPEEDQKIRENWRFFAKIRKIEKTPFEFLKIDETGLNIELGRQNWKDRMWPILCNGLDNRFAKMVLHRISYIFHPDYKENHEEYDLDEMRKQLRFKVPRLEIASSLRIPPRFVDRHHWTSVPRQDRLLVETDQRITILRILYESVKDDATNKFGTKNIDWMVFQKKCESNSISPPPTPHNVNESFRRMFLNAEKLIFKYLNPAPSLKSKMHYIHESFIRNAKGPVKNRWKKSDFPVVLKMGVLLTVVFEDYNKHGKWDIPVELQNIRAQAGLDLEQIRERLKRSQENRKRISDLPKAKYKVSVKKVKLEDGSIGETDQNEISSIHDIDSESQFDDYESEDPNTEISISTIGNTTSSSSFLLRNETIVAAGGMNRRDGEEEDLTIGSIHTQTIKPEESFALDESQDVWAQLMTQ